MKNDFFLHMQGKYPAGRPKRKYSYYSEDSEDTLSDDSNLENPGQHDQSSGLITCASAGTVWDIIPRARKRMYQHQVEAFEFLWTNLAGGTALEQLDKKLNFASGGGCIISHAPGTGKTFLTIVFVKAFMRKYPNCRPMIIAPTSILNTWERELVKWSKVGDNVPFHNLNNPDLSGKETFSSTSRLHKRRGRRANRSSVRWAKISSWRDATSILGISYTLYDRLARNESDSVRRALFELPGMIVLDEGHTPRNDKSYLWETLSNVKTERRVILSGTPFQNNFRELYNTLRLAKPAAVTNGNLEFLLKSYYRVESEKEKAEVISGIKDIIKPFVHVHKGNVLQEKLPGLKEAIVTLKPSENHMLVFDYIQKLRKSTAGSSNWFKFEHLMSVAAVHPKLFISELPEVERPAANGVVEKLDLSAEGGIKTKFVLNFIQQSERMKEKVLIFSQYVDPLKFLTEQIRSRFRWKEGEEILIISGKTQESTRQTSIDVFNNPRSKTRVMLASTKTCYEGINLVGASRVILLDSLWNPSAERQAVSRAYRIGQRRIVYTYRFKTAGTWDEEKLCVQAEKDQLSELVFSDPSEAGHHQNSSPVVFEDKLLQNMPDFGTTITAKTLT